MEPRVIAASAVVDRCPIEMTDAITRLYSNRCVLRGTVSQDNIINFWNAIRTQKLAKYIS
jgi:hypothetical protein